MRLLCEMSNFLQLPCFFFAAFFCRLYASQNNQKMVFDCSDGAAAAARKNARLPVENELERRHGEALYHKFLFGVVVLDDTIDIPPDPSNGIVGVVVACLRNGMQPGIQFNFQ